MGRFVVDRGLVAQVQQHLKARNERPRPKLDGRPNLKVTAGLRARDEDGGGTYTDVLLYDEISYFGIMAQDVADALDGVTGDLHVRINSPGGDVYDGVAIFNMLAGWDGAVRVTVDGIAASAASFIAQAGDEIVMNRGAQMMIHDAWGMCIGNAADMTDVAGILNRLSNTIADIYADRAGGTAENWRAAMRAESWYNAAEAITAKLADKMAPSRHAKNDDGGEEGPAVEPDEGMAARVDVSFFQFAGRGSALAPPMPAAREETPPASATAVGPHEGTAKEGTWDKGTNVGRLPSPMPVATARKVFALYDGDRVEDGKLPKDACSLPHHFVGEDGTPGAPSLNGVNAALSRLNQTQGYSDEERATAERHLRSHLPSDNEDNAAKYSSTVPANVSITMSATAKPPAPTDDAARLAQVRALADELDDEEAAARILQALDPPPDEPAPVAPAPPTPPEPPAPEPASAPEPAAAPAVDDKPDEGWAAATAHLTGKPAQNDWAAAIAHLGGSK